LARATSEPTLPDYLRGPETLQAFVAEIGAQAATIEEAANFGEVVFISEG
jgi:hypothetical protein